VSVQAPLQPENFDPVFADAYRVIAASGARLTAHGALGHDTTEGKLLMEPMPVPATAVVSLGMDVRPLPAR
jgi:hypothetical protein